MGYSHTTPNEDQETGLVAIALLPRPASGCQRLEAGSCRRLS